MRRSHTQSEKCMKSKQLFAFWVFLTFLLRLHSMSFHVSLPTSASPWATASFSPSFSLCVSLCYLTILHISSGCVKYMRVSAFMCESFVNVMRRAYQSALVYEQWHVLCGWRQLKVSVQWSTPVLLAWCVKHIKGQPLIPYPLFLFPLSVLSWHLSHPLSFLLLFLLSLPQSSLVYCILYLLWEVRLDANYPALWQKNSPGFRASYIYVEWGPHKLFSSKHT